MEVVVEVIGEGRSVKAKVIVEGIPDSGQIVEAMMSEGDS